MEMFEDIESPDDVCCGAKTFCCLGPMGLTVMATCLAFLGVAVSAFDLFTDILLTQKFIIKGTGYLKFILLGIVMVAIGLFMWELTILVRQLYLWCYGICLGKEKSDSEAYNKQRAKVSRLKELSSYLLLVCEDLPMNIFLIVFATLPLDNDSVCNLWKEVFQDSFIGKLALLGTVISAFVKGIISFKYCFTCEWYNIDHCGKKAFCCSLRLMRPIIALSICACSVAAIVVVEGHLKTNTQLFCEEREALLASAMTTEASNVTVYVNINDTINSTGGVQYTTQTSTIFTETTTIH